MQPDNQQPYQNQQGTPYPANAGPAQPPQQPGSAPQTPAAKPPAPASPPIKPNPNSTQNALLISEIRDGLVVMNDGSFRMVVACKSINFDLMSAREREAVEYSYQSFLNSLYFPVQILIRSQKVDLGPYLDRLDKMRRSQENMLLGVLTDDYIEFISQLAQETNIMDKNFYIVVPYFLTGDVNSAVNSSKGMLANLFAPQSQTHIRINSESYTKAKDELQNRCNTVINGLFQMGIKSLVLNTKQLGELYYNLYNPDTAIREPLGNFENLSGAVTTKGQGEAPQPHLDREIL